MRSLGITAVPLLALGLGASLSCGELAEPASVSTSPEPAVEPRAGAITLAEFSAYYDPTLEDLVFEMTVPEASDIGRYRTVPQALWCQVSNGDSDGQVELLTVADSIGETLAECGIPENFATVGQGAFCATVELRSRVPGLLVQPTAELLEISTGFRPWTWMETEGAVGRDPAEIYGPNAPSAVAVFGYPDLNNGENARALWAFQNSGGIQDLSFRGHIVAHAFESCNALDDDCDGAVDEGAGCYSDGDACNEHADCASGNCDTGVCAPTACADGTLNGSETDVDCGGSCAPCAIGASCALPTDCASGYCNSGTCGAYGVPSAGDVVFSEVMVDPGPSTYDGFEWFEISNTTASELVLDCRITDGEQTIDFAGQRIAPFGQRVFAAHRTPQGDALDAEWATHQAALPADTVWYSPAMVLSNHGETLTLTCGGAEIDHIAFTPGTRGRALQVDAASVSAAGNDVPINRCDARSVYAGSFFGSPGAANHGCDVPIDSCTLAVGDAIQTIAGTAASVPVRVNAPGFTDATVANDPLSARAFIQVGVGPADTVPSDAPAAWTWTDAVSDTGWNDASAPGLDQYLGSVGAALAAGERVALAARVTGDAGATWTVCEGASSLTATNLSGINGPGDVLFSEVQPDGPGPDPASEWIEVYNATDRTVNLAGCTLAAGAGAYEFHASVEIAAGDVAVLAHAGASADFMVNYADATYETVTLGNTSDTLVLRCPVGGTPTEIDRFSYDEVWSSVFGHSTFASVQVDPAALSLGDNDSVGNACMSTYPSPQPEYSVDAQTAVGTPGATNPPCFIVHSCQTDEGPEFVLAGGEDHVEGLLYLRPWLLPAGPGTVLRAQVGSHDRTVVSDSEDWDWTEATLTEASSTTLRVRGTTNALDVSSGSAGRLVRFSTDGGATWLYCDRLPYRPPARAPRAASTGLGDPFQTISPVAIDACDFAPRADVPVAESSALPVDVAVTVPGLTEPSGHDAHPAIVVRVGHRYELPNGLYVFSDLVDAVGSTGDEMGADWYTAEVLIPNNATAEIYARVSGDLGATWLDCDAAEAGHYSTLPVTSPCSESFGVSCDEFYDGYLKPGTSDYPTSGFGTGVVVEGDRMAVFSGDTSWSSTARVTLYERTDEEWTHVRTLSGYRRGFGLALALEGETLVIGAPEDDGSSSGVHASAQSNSGSTNSGAVYVYDWPDSEPPTLQAYIKAPTAESYAYFGRAVAVSGDRIAVGAPYQDAPSAANNGAVNTYVRSGDTWVHERTFYGPSSARKAYNEFGRALSFVGDRLAIGAPGMDSSGTGVGASPSAPSNSNSSSSGGVFIYRWSGSSVSSETFIKATTNATNLRFGEELDYDGQYLVVGLVRQDSALLFERDGTSWSRVATFVGDESDDDLGSSVAVSNGRIAVAATGEDVCGSGLVSWDDSCAQVGAVHVYEERGHWQRVASLRPTSPTPSDYFGGAVSMSGPRLAVVARGDDSDPRLDPNDPLDDSDSDTGAVYIYNLAP